MENEITEEEAIKQIKNLSTLIIGGIVGGLTIILVVSMYFGGFL